MSASEAGAGLRDARPGSEVERLRQELAAVRQRLEEEVAYHRAKAETSRQQIEAQHLRQQAAEVARRRRLEDQVATLEAQLRESRDHGDRVQRRYDELANQFLQQEESTRHSVQEEVARYKAAAQSAWQSAEEELARMEGEMHRLREALNAERSRSRQLEETLRSLQGLDGNVDEDEADSLRGELSTLRKALDLSERRRVQLQQRTVRLAEQLVGMQGKVSELQQSAEDTDKARADSEGAAQVRNVYRSFHTGAGNPTQVDLSEANAILRAAAAQNAVDAESKKAAPALDVSGGLDDDIAEEFLLMSADSSLDAGKLERLQQQVEKQEAQDRARQTVQTARRNGFLEDEQDAAAAAGKAHQSARKPVAPSPQPVREARGGLSLGQHFSKLAQGLLVVALLLALGGIAIWFLGVDILP